MKITLLGTGTSQGVPVIACNCLVCRSTNPRDNRLRSSILVEDEDTTVVIDSGPDFRAQMLRHRVKRLDAIIITHSHKDHTGGLDDVRAFNFIQQADMQVYADLPTQQALKLQYDYIFKPNPYPGIPRVNFINIEDDEEFRIGNIHFQPVRVMHYHMPVLGFRIGKFTYITDANEIPDAELAKIEGSEVLVLNALRKEKHISHFTLDEAVKLIQQLKPRQAYITHISHQMGLHDVVNRELPKGIELGYDGLQIEL